jgi:hypothetical protein
MLTLAKICSKDEARSWQPKREARTRKQAVLETLIQNSG